jgi:hypothetical protein
VRLHDQGYVSKKGRIALDSSKARIAKLESGDSCLWGLDNFQRT